MKENIEELRANVERTEMAGLTFIATRVACARAALDYIAQLEQTSRAQRTTSEELKDAKRDLLHIGAYLDRSGAPDTVINRLKSVQDYLAAAPAAGPAGLAKLDDATITELAERHDLLSIQDGGRVDFRSLSAFAADVALLAAPVAADTEQATADVLSDEEKAALERLDKPEWRAASNLKLRAILAVEVANCIRMGAKIENLQDELRATDGYRQGYKDGAADAASIAEVENDWRSIWDDRSPIQGEGVLATNGETVIAARWLATGWAEHGLDDVDIMDYLPEGWVTHWKPMPAAPAAPAADTNAQGEE